MGLIGPEYTILAGPPSLQSCTRDIYPQGYEISIKQLLAILKAIAGTAAHLHARGIMHGDLYAHNILKNHNGDCLLGDFGAASVYPVAVQDIPLISISNSISNPIPTLEQIEVRAFGCLIEELIDHCSALDISSNAVQNTRLSPQLSGQLIAMKNACLQDATHLRPYFSELFEQLGQIAAAHNE